MMKLKFAIGVSKSSD